MSEVGFMHGVLAPSYEKQANAQGYTLGETADAIDRIGDGLLLAYIHNVLTDSDYDKALQRFQNKVLVPRLKPLKEGKNDGR